MESSKIKIVLLMRGNTGKDVAGLKKALRKALGEGAAAYPGIAAGNEFDAETALTGIFSLHATLQQQ